MSEIGSGMKKVARTGTTFGIVLIVLGVLSMMAPLLTGVAVAVLVALLLLVAGVARLMWAFRAGSFGRGALTFLLGGLMILTGVLTLARPLIGLTSLTLLLAAFFAADGLTEIVAAFKVRPVQGWGWLLFGGIVSLVLAWLIWSGWPLSGAWAVGVLVGVKLLFAGIEMVSLGRMGGAIADRLAAR